MAQLMIFFQVSSLFHRTYPPKRRRDTLPFLFAQLFVAILLRAELVQKYPWYHEVWITSTLLVGNTSVAFAEPVVFVGVLLLAVVRNAFNKDDGDQDQASKRSATNAKCRVLEEDRKVLIAQLRQKKCCEAMATAAQNAAVGAEAYLAVQQVLYQSSTASELVALTVVDDATCDSDFDLPVILGHPHTTEGGGVQPSAMEDTEPAVCGACFQ